MPSPPSVSMSRSGWETPTSRNTESERQREVELALAALLNRQAAHIRNPAARGTPGPSGTGLGGPGGLVRDAHAKRDHVQIRHHGQRCQRGHGGGTRAPAVPAIHRQRAEPGPDERMSERGGHLAVTTRGNPSSIPHANELVRLALHS